jgi:hypothetical protein
VAPIFFRCDTPGMMACLMLSGGNGRQVLETDVNGEVAYTVPGRHPLSEIFRVLQVCHWFFARVWANYPDFRGSLRDALTSEIALRSMHSFLILPEFALQNAIWPVNCFCVYFYIFNLHSLFFVICCCLCFICFFESVFFF